MSLIIKVKDYYAVKEAQIDISGITVLSGINGCGKSTIARAFYELMKGTLDFDKSVDESINENLKEIAQLLRSLIHAMTGLIPRNEAMLMSLDILNNKDESSIYRTIESLISWASSYGKVVSIQKKLLLKSAQSMLSTYVGEVDIDATDLEYFVIQLQKLKIKVEKLKNESIEQKNQREISFFQKKWRKRNGKGLDLKSFNVFENEIPICDASRNIVSLPNSVDKVIYIDTPMAFLESAPSFVKWYWNDLEYEMHLSEGNTINDEFKIEDDEDSGILLGEFKWNEKRNDLIYRQPDGVEFSMRMNGATGLKSFVMLRNLYKAGRIGEKTVLIMDEPEAHLHPQWVVRFARFLVFLHQKTKCKMFISSHSTDMISSLKNISKNVIGNIPSFYLAKQPEKNNFKYTYLRLGEDIEPIFEVI